MHPRNPHEIANSELWTIRPNGTGLRRLTNTPTYEFAPVWSPVGNRIAYQEGISCPAVVVANADGTRPRRVPGDCVGDPDWAPGGGRLVVTLDDIRSANNITLIRPDGSDRRDLTHGFDPAWRPR